MNRIELINYLIYQRNFKRYLEISNHDKKNNFLFIRCAYKVTTFPFTSNDFFSYNKTKFEIIFIDGIHIEEQVLKDIDSAKRSLAKRGVIILHDCMPPDTWHQREWKEFQEGENWTGAVWKAALREFNETKWKCTLINTDWGCGIIDTSLTQTPKRRILPGNLDYEHHYPWLVEYKKSAGEFLKSQVKIFYHLACMGNWQEVFIEQVSLLKQNGFGEINITLLGREEDLDFINMICAEKELKVRVIFKARELRYFEKPALIAIEEYAKNHEGYVLYLHSKGVSNHTDADKIKWRRLMMQELIQNWESCMMQLPYYDAIGVNWRDMPPTSHFCGNFWYASTKYLRRLANFSSYFDNPRYNIHDRIDNKRLGCEFWISSGDVTPKVLSLYCRNVDFCDHNFWREK